MISAAERVPLWPPDGVRVDPNRVCVVSFQSITVIFVPLKRPSSDAGYFSLTRYKSVHLSKLIGQLIPFSQKKLRMNQDDESESTH
jgi:hypothetical protein